MSRVHAGLPHNELGNRVIVGNIVGAGLINYAALNHLIDNRHCFHHGRIVVFRLVIIGFDQQVRTHKLSLYLSQKIWCTPVPAAGHNRFVPIVI